MMHRFFAYDKKESVIRMFLPIAVVALLGFAFIGCAGKSSQRTGAFPVVEEDLQARSLVPSPSKSLVYCYDENFVMLWKYTIELDGVSSKIQGNSYLVWEVEPGKHTFKVTFDKIMSKDSFSTNIKTEGGRTYYYHLVAGKEQTASTGSYDAFRYNFDKVSEATGRKKIEDFSLMAWFRDGRIVFRRELDAAAEAEPEALEPELTPIPEAAPVPELEASPEPGVPAEAFEESTLAIQGAYYALVVGISEYEHLETLPGAVNDAQAVTKALRDYGFKVNTLFDEKATRAGILDSLDAFQRLLKPEDRFLLYYAGHSQFGADDQIVYWQPVEAKEDSMAQWIVVDSITAALKQMPAVHILVVADSLYSGTFPQSLQADLKDAALRQRYLEKIAQKRARVILTSGATQPSPATSEVGLSLFARAFVAGLADLGEIGHKAFTAEELFQGYILAIVAGQSERMPAFQAIRNSGHEGGDFIFVKE